MNADDRERLQRAAEAWRRGHYEKAFSLLQQRVESGGAPRDVCLFLARAASRLGDRHTEIQALEQALSSATDCAADAPLWGRLGSLCWARGDSRAAARAFSRATQLDAAELPAWEGLGRALLARQDIAGAHCVCERMLAQFPRKPFTHLLAAHLAKAEGNSASAGRHYRKALDLVPTSGEALFGLVDLDTPRPDSPLAKRAFELGECAPGPVDRINAAFASARIFDRAGNYPQAVEALQRANSAAVRDLEQRGILDHSERLGERAAAIQCAYPAQSLRNHAPVSKPGAFSKPGPLSELEPFSGLEPRPIFVLGLPRSGTTLVEQILAGHPEVQAGGELPFARECESWFRRQRSLRGVSGPVDPRSPEDAPLLATARARYLQDLGQANLERATWVVDKMPANFEIAGFLRMLFPEAPIVHTQRDLRATAFSLYSANFAAHEPYYHSLEGLARYARYYRALMEHWRNCLGDLVEIHYEALVADPDARIPEFLQEVGVGIYPGCTEPHRHQRAVLTASHAEVRRPIHTGAVDHWRHYESWLGPLLTLEVE